MKRNNSALIWQEIIWQRPFTQSDVLELFTHLAVLSPRKQIVWEVRGSAGKVRYFVATQRRYMKPLKTAITAHGQITFSDVADNTRKDVDFARLIKRSKPALSLATAKSLSVLKTALSALAEAKKGETLVIQIILGESHTPTPSPDKAENPHANLLDKVCGTVGTASAESLTSIKNKAVQHGFLSVIRIGATAKYATRVVGLLNGLTSAFRQFETAGVKITFPTADPDHLNQAKIPFFLLLQLSIAELAGFALVMYFFDSIYGDLQMSQSVTIFIKKCQKMR